MKYNKDVELLAEAYQLIAEAGDYKPINPYSGIKLVDDKPVQSDDNTFVKGNPDEPPPSQYQTLIQLIKEQLGEVNHNMVTFIKTPREDERNFINATGQLNRSIHMMLTILDQIKELEPQRR